MQLVLVLFGPITSLNIKTYQGLLVFINPLSWMYGKEATFMTKTSNTFSLGIGSEISLKDFSFSQLIIAVKKLFDTDGVPGFIKCLVVLVESLLIKSIVQCPHCGLNLNIKACLLLEQSWAEKKSISKSS